MKKTWIELAEFNMDINEIAKYRESPDEVYPQRTEVLECLLDGLQFLKSDAAIPAQQLAKRILANIIIEHLDMSGYGIFRKASRQDANAEHIERYSMPAM
jgi:hypothetical protein